MRQFQVSRQNSVCWGSFLTLTLTFRAALLPQTSATLWKTREEFNQLHIDLDLSLNYYRDANLDDKIGPWEAWLNVLDKRTFDQNTMSLGAAANILR